MTEEQAVEREREYQHAYYQVNRELKLAHAREYRHANRERILVQMHEYNLANKERQLQYQRGYYRANRERVLARVREYRRANPEMFRDIGRRRRVAKNGCASERFKTTDIFERDKWKCKMCGCKTPKALHGGLEPNAPVLDHIIPLSLGGPHTKANTRCLCRQCNGKKAAKYEGQLAFA